MKRTIPGLLLAIAMAVGCSIGCSIPHDVPHEVCEACITKDGVTGCGRVDVNLKQHPDVTDDMVKLRAGQQACKELAARKGGGYAGPLYQQAFKECAAKVTPKDLFRTQCDPQIRTENWQPKDGIDAY